MINCSPSKAIIICECGLYDLETFLGHQEYSQRHEEKGDIIKVNSISASREIL